MAAPDHLKSMLAELDRLRLAPTLPVEVAVDLVATASDEIWRRLNEPGTNPPIEALVLPAVLERLRPRPRFEQDWGQMRRRLSVAWSRDRAAVPAVPLLFVDAICSGIGIALARHIARLAAAPLADDLPAADQLGRRLTMCGWFDRVHPAAIAAMKRTLAAARSDPRRELTLRLHCIGALGFGSSVAVEWLDALFETLVGPTILLAIERGRDDIALFLEGQIYTRYFNRTGTIAQHRRCYDPMAPALAAAGRRQRERLSALPRAGTSGPPRVGFLINAPGLTPATVLMSFFLGLSRVSAPPLRPVLYVLSGANESFERKAVGFGVPVVWLERLAQSTGGTLERLLALRERSAADGLTAMVWLSPSLFMSYAFGLRIAPVQIWWSMRYHTISLDDIDGYLTGGLFERWRTIDGRRWRVLQIGLPDMFRPEHAPRAQELRRRHGADRGMLLLGWMGRGDKIANRPFVAALARVLARLPQAIFLWTGRWQPPELLQLFDEFGIRPRCRHIGWVDTKLYAQVFDLYLDGFPVVSGHSAFDAMAAGVPVVVLVTPESLSSGMPKNVYRVYAGMAGSEAEQAEVRALFTGADGEDLTGFTHDVDQFVERAVQLALDPELRRRVGEAGREFLRRYLYDVEALARTASEHILEIIAERLGEPEDGGADPGAAPT